MSTSSSKQLEKTIQNDAKAEEANLKKALKDLKDTEKSQSKAQKVTAARIFLCFTDEYHI
jgi:hypothetical protein